MTKLWFSTSCAALVLVSAQGLAAQNEDLEAGPDLFKQILERQKNLEEQNEDLRDEIDRLREQISELEPLKDHHLKEPPLAEPQEAQSQTTASTADDEEGSMVILSSFDQRASRIGLTLVDAEDEGGSDKAFYITSDFGGENLISIEERRSICPVPKGADAYAYFAARPFLFEQCLGGARGGDGQGNGPDGIQPGRPLLQSGFFPQLEFGNKSKATLNASFPFRARRCDLEDASDSVVTSAIDGNPLGDNSTRLSVNTKREVNAQVCKGNYRPVAWNITGTVKTDLTDGVGRLLDSRDRDDRTDLDFLPGTSLSLGLDYIRFDKSDPADNLRKAVIKAQTACTIAFHDKVDAKDDETAAEKCAEDKVLAWAMQVKKGKYVHPAIAAAIRDSIWMPSDTGKIDWGIGGSVEFSSPDFTFREGNILPDMNSDGDNILKVDPNVALASSVIESRSQWELELHALYSFDLTKTIRFMPVAQVSYRSVTEFQPGTKITLCSETAGSEFTTTSCSDIQAERSMRRDLTTLSLEGRTKFDRLPYIRALGFAPRLAHTIESGQTFLDLPFYVSDKSGNLSGGLRFRFARGGEDVLGNPLDDFEEISLFFTPLKFDSFK